MRIIYPPQTAIPTNPCGECEALDVPVIRFDDNNHDFEVSFICATCLRAALEMLEPTPERAP